MKDLTQMTNEKLLESLQYTSYVKGCSSHMDDVDTSNLEQMGKRITEELLRRLATYSVTTAPFEATSN